MTDFISREAVMQKFLERGDGYITMMTMRDMINEIPAADCKPISVVAEHIKACLYETAFNTSDAVARNTIADMAKRVDYWINELKDGDTKVIQNSQELIYKKACGADVEASIEAQKSWEQWRDNVKAILETEKNREKNEKDDIFEKLLNSEREPKVNYYKT